MKNKVVTITAGHSNTDSGAVGFGVKESDLAIKFRNAVTTYLKAQNILVRNDGVGTDNKDLKHAISLIKGSDVALEIHLNSSTNKTANGIECVCLEKDKVLAQKLSAAVAKVTGSRLRADKGAMRQEDSARGRLGYVNAGGLILEIFFLSNESELKVFEEKYWLIAKEVAKVLVDYVRSKA